MLSPVLISSFDVEGASVEAFASYTITYGENDVAVIFTPSDVSYAGTVSIVPSALI